MGRAGLLLRGFLFMTLAVATPVVSYVGTGTSNAFPFSFPVFSSSHLVVSIRSADLSTNYVLTLNTDFTVSGLSPNGSPALPGTITLVNSGQAWLSGGFLITGYTITIQRLVPLSQNLSVRNQGSFYPANLEDAYDYITMILQQLNVPNQNPVYTDIVTGATYQIVFVDGVLSSQRLT